LAKSVLRKVDQKADQKVDLTVAEKVGQMAV
jgi:hypothetical protein